MRNEEKTQYKNNRYENEIRRKRVDEERSKAEKTIQLKRTVLKKR